MYRYMKTGELNNFDIIFDIYLLIQIKDHLIYIVLYIRQN